MIDDEDELLQRVQAAKDALRVELQTRFGIESKIIEYLLDLVTEMNDCVEKPLELLAATTSPTNPHDQYHKLDLAFATAYLRFVEVLASICPLHGEKYATL